MSVVGNEEDILVGRCHIVVHFQVFAFRECCKLICHLAGRAQVPELAVGERRLNDSIYIACLVVEDSIICVVADIACHDMCCTISPTVEDWIGGISIGSRVYTIRVAI